MIFSVSSVLIDTATAAPGLAKKDLVPKLAAWHMRAPLVSFTLSTLVSLTSKTREGLFKLLDKIGKTLETEHANILEYHPIVDLTLPFRYQLEKIDFDHLLSNPAMVKEVFDRCVLPSGVPIVKLSPLVFIYQAFKESAAK